MRNSFRTILAFLFAFATLSSVAAADVKFAVGAEPYPPFSLKDTSGKWSGWEIDAMNAVCSHLGEKCEVVEVAWDGIIPALTARQVDVIWSSMAITEERKKTIDFSDMYYNSQILMIGRKDAGADLTPEGLKGKTIGVQTSSIHERYVEKYFGSVATIKTYQTQDEANADLAAGRVDYVQANASTLYAFLATPPGQACCDAKGNVPPDPEILGQGVGAGIRKDDTVLKEKLNAAIRSAAAAGDFERITKNYPELEKLIVLPQKEQD